MYQTLSLLLCLLFSHLFATDASLFTGFVRGKSQRFITHSNFEWPIEIFTLGGTLNFDFCCDRAHLTLEGWNQVASKSVKMFEEDFFSTPGVLTNFSLSPNTHLTNAFLIFFEGRYDFIEQCPFKLGGLLGYQYSQFDWRAKGGSQINIVPVGSLVVFPYVTVARYQQKFSVPYIGLMANFYHASLFGKYSPFAYAKDRDQHHFFPYAGLTFNDCFRNKNYWIVGAKIAVFLTRSILFDFKYSYEAFEKTKGSSSSIYHAHNTIELGLTADF